MSYKILVIDDSMVASRQTGDLLAQSFHNTDVLVAQRATEGLERFQVVEPDVIVLNDTMPDLDGDAALYRLLNDPITSGVPVILLSSNGRTLQEKYKNASSGRSQKPVTQELLVTAVSGALEHAKPKPNPANLLLFRDYSKITFSGHTGFFSLHAALKMALLGQAFTGVPCIFLNRYPVELLYLERAFRIRFHPEFPPLPARIDFHPAIDQPRPGDRGAGEPGGHRLPAVPLSLQPQRIPARGRGENHPRTRPAAFCEPLDGGAREFRILSGNDRTAFPGLREEFPADGRRSRQSGCLPACVM